MEPRSRSIATGLLRLLRKSADGATLPEIVGKLAKTRFDYTGGSHTRESEFKDAVWRVLQDLQDLEVLEESADGKWTMGVFLKQNSGKMVPPRPPRVILGDDDDGGEEGIMQIIAHPFLFVLSEEVQDAAINRALEI